MFVTILIAFIFYLICSRFSLNNTVRTDFDKKFFYPADKIIEKIKKWRP